MMSRESTQAKIGRSMKNFGMAMSVNFPGPAGEGEVVAAGLNGTGLTVMPG
jgi:hypothetical protein